MERTNTKDIVSKVAYLIGVKKTVLYNEFDIIRALEAARQLSARRKGEDNYAYAIENMNSGKIGKEYAELYRNLANLSL